MTNDLEARQQAVAGEKQNIDAIAICLGDELVGAGMAGASVSDGQVNRAATAITFADDLNAIGLISEIVAILKIG